MRASRRGRWKSIERQHAAQLRLDPVERRVVGRFRHRKDAAGIGAQQQRGRDDVEFRRLGQRATSSAYAGLGRSPARIFFQPADVVGAVGDGRLG